MTATPAPLEAVPQPADPDPEKPRTVEVPYDLAALTIEMCVLRLPVAQGYILAKRWEQIIPALFQPGPRA